MSDTELTKEQYARLYSLTASYTSYLQRKIDGSEGEEEKSFEDELEIAKDIMVKILPKMAN